MFSHVDKDGKATMVDVSKKGLTLRRAFAKGSVNVGKKVLQLIIDNNIKKGDVLSTAKIAGILAAKKVGELIPLCHPLNLTFVDIKFQFDLINHSVLIFSEVAINAPTGVEMEALVAIEIAALTIYDMCKGVDKSITVGECYLIKKTGGKSGTFRNNEKLNGYINFEKDILVKGEEKINIIGLLPEFIEHGDKLKIGNQTFPITTDNNSFKVYFDKSVKFKKGVVQCQII